MRRPIITTHRTGNKFTSKWDGPYVIQEVYSNGTYKLVMGDGLRIGPINDIFLRNTIPDTQKMLLDRTSLNYEWQQKKNISKLNYAWLDPFWYVGNLKLCFKFSHPFKKNDFLQNWTMFGLIPFLVLRHLGILFQVQPFK